MEELILVQLQRIGRNSCSDLRWDGSFNFSSVPDATGDPSNAWRATAISPKHTKSSACSTRLATVSCWVRLFLERNWLATSEASKLNLRKSNHSPDANFWTRSDNLLLGTLPPLRNFVNSRRGRNVKSFQPLVIRDGLSNSMSLTTSCNVTHIAKRYAPLKNAGTAFITQTLREKTSWTLTMRIPR